MKENPDLVMVQSHELVVCTVQGPDENIKDFVREVTALAGAKGCDVELEEVK